ncbi:RidA family protein [Domibacillus mangrovi]|uniref:Enamine deaminase RidA n=1 Tax=Domibacillus mangrovi TaxID=1714354 RepID=A0A1Q5P6A6_9BACI|nr:RidA family protein [Domibacillus mangrovi]OKL37786.1 hypothetical protein BLL40_02890 [Domibacillus mangrovi]
MTLQKQRELFKVATQDPTHPYSSAVRFGDLVWTSGQIGMNSQGGIPDEFSEQIDLAFDNLEAALKTTGANLSTVLKISAFVTDINRLEEFNEVYRRRVTMDGAPARTTVQIASFQENILVEIDAVAYVANSERGKQ